MKRLMSQALARRSTQGSLRVAHTLPLYFPARSGRTRPLEGAGSAGENACCTSRSSAARASAAWRLAGPGKKSIRAICSNERCNRRVALCALRSFVPLSDACALRMAATRVP
jgi:hypothetical protein